MAKREHKPRCCWERSRSGPRFRQVGGQCKAPACFDWPVCRSHLEVWAQANPLEVIKRRSLRLAVLTYRDSRVVVFFIATNKRIRLSLNREEATVAADWYDASGDKISALMLRARVVELSEGRSPTVEQIYAELDELRKRKAP